MQPHILVWPKIVFKYLFRHTKDRVISLSEKNNNTYMATTFFFLYFRSSKSLYNICQFYKREGNEQICYIIVLLRDATMKAANYRWANGQMGTYICAIIVAWRCDISGRIFDRKQIKRPVLLRFSFRFFGNIECQQYIQQIDSDLLTRIE